MPQLQAPPERTSNDPAPDYSIGATFVPATKSTSQSQNAEATTNLNRLIGTTRADQVKTLLAAIGILAIFLRVTKLVR